MSQQLPSLNEDPSIAAQDPADNSALENIDQLAQAPEIPSLSEFFSNEELDSFGAGAIGLTHGFTNEETATGLPLVSLSQVSDASHLPSLASSSSSTSNSSGGHVTS